MNSGRPGPDARRFVSPEMKCEENKSPSSQHIVVSITDEVMGGGREGKSDRRAL